MTLGHIRCVRLEAALSRMISVWHHSTARARRERTDPILLNHSCCTFMSYTDHSARRRFKSNTPIFLPRKVDELNIRDQHRLIPHAFYGSDGPWLATPAVSTERVIVKTVKPNKRVRQHLTSCHMSSTDTPLNNTHEWAHSPYAGPNLCSFMQYKFVFIFLFI